MAGSGYSNIITWDLIRSPVPMFSAQFLYIFAIYYGIPRFMRNKEAYSLKGFIRCYNIFQVIANFWLTYNLLNGCRSWYFVWRYCDTMKDVCGHNAERENLLRFLAVVANSQWIYQICSCILYDSSKLTPEIKLNFFLLQQFELVWYTVWLRVFDFIETMIFLLRKKDRQVSFLHVYHHISTTLCSWSCVKYCLHSFVIFIAMINSATHAVMYLYYLLSSYGPNMQQRLYLIKKWLTTIQMTQIMLITLPPVQGLIFNCDGTDRLFSMIIFLDGLTNLILFWNFYMKSYTKVKKIK